MSAQEERTNQHRANFTNRTSSSAYRNKVAARNRALSYSFAWLLSWITIFLIVSMRLFGIVDNLLPFPLGLVHFSLFPLQGLFNFMMYVFSRVKKRLEHCKREGVAHPKRFLFAFRDSIMSRGQDLSRANRTRSRLLNRRSLQLNRNIIGSVNLTPENPPEKESHNSQSLLDRSTTIGVIQENVEKENSLRKE